MHVTGGVMAHKKKTIYTDNNAIRTAQENRFEDTEKRGHRLQ